jgi:hypothetical protein
MARNSTISIFLDEHVEGEGQEPLEGDPPFGDGGQDTRQAGLGQDHARRGLGHVRRRRYRDPDLRLPECGRIVHAVAAHAHDVAMALQHLDQPILLCWQDARKDAELLGPRLLGRPLGRAHAALDADLSGNGRRGGRRIARHHDGADAHTPERRHERRGILARGIAERNQASQAQG